MSRLVLLQRGHFFEKEKHLNYNWVWNFYLETKTFMDLTQCQQSLRQEYSTDTTVENISKLTSVRGSNKAECYTKMWGPTKIQNFLKTTKKNGWLTTAVISTENTESHSAANYETSTSTTDNNLEIMSTIKFYGGVVIKVFIWLILIILFTKLIKYLLSFAYDVLNSNRMRYLKILVPRWDGKLDREQAKELAKDMKEKIGRMSQVYNNIHKLWELSMRDNVLKFFFRKPKVTFMYHYEWWLIYLIVAVYPEYQKIVESSISSQYPACSIETIKKPKIFAKKYSYIMPMQTKKDSVYTIKMYKQSPDDQINNLINAVAKVPGQDTFTIMMSMKPMWEKWNKNAKKTAWLLFKKDPKALKKTSFLKMLFMPRKIIWFFINGPSEDLINRHADKKGWDPILRMVKSEEETLNAMWEEAANAAFYTWLILVTTTDIKERLRDNMNLVTSAYNVYWDQYGNELDNPEKIADILHFFLQKLWKITVKYFLPNFFIKPSIFTINELTTLCHVPDATYNRANIIDWMQYKVLPAPTNLPVMSNFNGFIMSGIVAENYKWWKLTEILKEYKKHRAVAEKTEIAERLEPAEKFSKKQLMHKDIVEKDGKQMVKVQYEKKVVWYKMTNDGVLLGVNIYKNKYEPVYMKRDDRTRHHYCIWKSGTWKSVYLQSVARQDMWNGDGLCVIDPHGDLVEDILKYVPKERAKDVIFFDAGNEDRPMWLNLYEINNIDEADRTVNDATEIFIKMFGPEIFGPRIQEYFKYGSLTILEDFEDRPTILDVPRLFTDETYREFKTKNIQNPVVKNFREKTYKAMWDREKAEIIPYFTSKFVSFNTNRLIRNIIWQTKSAFNLDDVMNNKKILLISLSKGKIWDMNAQLLGMILVSKIYTAAMARAKIPQNERKDFYLYVDEFQNFVSATFADILSEARKYRLCLIMAHQYIAQLESGKQEWWKADVKAAVFGNVWTMQSFKVGAPDAEFLEKEYSPVLWAQDIVGIANYKAYIKLNIDNATTRPFSMNSIYTSDYENKKLPAILKEYSAKKYWRKREFVDAEMAARMWVGIDELDNIWEGKKTLDQAKKDSVWKVPIIKQGQPLVVNNPTTEQAQVENKNV